MLFLLRFTDAKTGRGHFSSLYTDPPITGGGGRGGGGGRWESAVTRNFCLLALLLIYLIYILFNNVIKIYINCILLILGLPKVIINFSQ